MERDGERANEKNMHRKAVGIDEDDPVRSQNDWQQQRKKRYELMSMHVQGTKTPNESWERMYKGKKTESTYKRTDVNE